jgi:hypothetical protein
VIETSPIARSASPETTLPIIPLSLVPRRSFERELLNAESYIELIDVHVKLKCEASVDKSRYSVPSVIWYEEESDSFIFLA